LLYSNVAGIFIYTETQQIVNIQLEKHDDLNLTVIISLGKEDYQEKVEKEVKRIQKSANIKGFRPGKAPLGMVQKLYGKGILAEEIQNMASDAMNKYIQDEKLDILGYPIASTKVESEIDIEASENFKFAFDLGMAPQFGLNISSKDTLEQFDIQVGEKEVTDDINHSRKRHGKMFDVETAADEDIIYAGVTELTDGGEVLEGGIAEKSISFVASMIEDKKAKKSVLGKKVGDELIVSVKTLLNNNETVISNTLGIAKEGVADLSDHFKIVITEIKRRTDAELNEEYYREVFGEQEIPASEEEYRAKIQSNLENYYRNEADLWLDHQIGHLLMEKHPIELPDEFLKRWLITTKENEYNFENIEEKYAEEKSALQRRLVIDKIAASHNLQSTEEDIREEARIYFHGLYRQYGLNIPMNDAFLDESINKRLAEREFVMQMADRVIYRKAYDAIKGDVTLKSKKISVEDYFKHVNAHKSEHGE
jgi:trigger factor